MERKSMVADVTTYVASTSDAPPKQPILKHHSASQAKCKTPAPTSKIDSMPLVRQKLAKTGLSDNVIDIMIKGWRLSSRLQYSVYLKKWTNFCKERKHDPLSRNDKKALEFLRKLFKQGYSYSAINTARSSLSTIFDNPSFGNTTAVQQFMRGVYNLRPNIPRYKATWDVSIVLRHLEKCAPIKYLSLQQLSHKLTTLLALVTGQRVQTLHALSLTHCHIQKDMITFNIQSILKHSTPKNKTSNTIDIPAFHENKRICPVFCCIAYIKRTRMLRGETKELFINHQKPYKPVSKATISRWIKVTLNKAGINTNIYKAHSTRAASTSAAAKTIDIGTVLRAASWTNVSTFRRLYQKEVPVKGAFGKSILKTL